jgi:hypothetical protein
MNTILIANGELQNIPTYWNDTTLDANIYLISDSPPSYKHSDYKHFRKCTFGIFEDLDQYESLKLDSKLLLAFAHCESITLKMMERYDFYCNLFSYNARIDLYHKQLQYWYNYIVKNEIKYVIFSVTPHVIFDYVIYCVCKYLGVGTILLYRTTIVVNKNVSIYAYEDIDLQIPALEKRYAFHLINPGAASLSERVSSYYSLRDSTPGNTFTGVSTKSLTKYFSLSSYINSIKFRIRYFNEWRQYMSPSDIVSRIAARLIRSKKYIFNSSAAPSLNCKYVYVALHYQPECSTSPMGGYFVHQDLMLDLLMAGIPSDWSIYIKGHLREGLSPTLARRIGFDKRTTLVDERFPSIELIKNAQAVATVTGTAGFEAFINKVPVLMFGSYFYQHAPGVFRIRTHADLASAVRSITSEKCILSDEQIHAFLKALDDETIAGWVDNRYEAMSKISSKENCRRISFLVASLIVGNPA